MGHDPYLPTPGCDCNVELDELPICDDPLVAILSIVAYEQSEMARILKVLRCKLCKSASWMPDSLSLSNSETIKSVIEMDQDVTQVIKALTDKENAIANKLSVVSDYENIIQK